MAIHATTIVRFKQTNTGYSLVCSPTQISLDGEGVVRTGYETVTVSVSKSVDGAPTSVIGDSDELAIHVEKVVNSGSGNVTSDVIALADGALSSSVQSRSFSVGNVTGLVFFVVSLYKKDATDAYVKIGNCFVSPTSDGANGDSIASADAYFYMYSSGVQPTIDKIPTDATKWTATTVEGLGAMTGLNWLYSGIKVTYTNGTVKMTGIRFIGNAKDFAATVEVYANGDSSSTAPTSDSFATTTTPIKGKWFWSGIKITMLGQTSSSIINTVCIGYVGNDGINGDDGITYWCTPTSVNMSGMKVGSYYCPQDGTITLRFYARKGIEDLGADIITSNDVSIPTQGWLGSLQGESEAIFDAANGYGTFNIVNTGASLTVQSQVLEVTCRFTDVNDVVYTHVFSIPWQVILNGTNGATGRTGAMTYCAGAYDTSKDYQATATAHPYVIVEDKSTTPSTIGRWRLDDETAAWNGGGTRYPKDDTAKWSQITDLQEIFASVAFIEFGKLASAVFSGDYMLSQYGVEDGKASANYKNFLGYNEDGMPKGFDPNICIDFLNGRAIFKGDSLFQGIIKSANFFQNLDFITAESDGITHIYDSHLIDRTASISDVMLLSGDFGHCLATIDNMQYHVAKAVYLTIPNANLGKFRGKQIRIVNNAWCKLVETTTGSYYFSSNVSVNADGGGMIYDMSLVFGGNTLRAYWEELNMNSQHISSMTLLSAPFNGSGLGLEWNWVIIDKKEMTSQEVRELRELY